MAKSDAGFGQGVGKLQRTILGKHKDLRYEILMRRARLELPKDDQRRISLEAADSFSNAFPANLDASIKLANDEFTTGIQRKLGLPLSCLWLHVGEPIATNGKSRRLRVDPFGNNVAAAPGVSGDQARTTHDAFVTRVVRLVKEAGIPASGGGYGSVKGVFSKNINQGNLPPADQGTLNGIIPDAKIDGRAAVRLADRPPNKLHDAVTLVEVKGLATVAETVAHRAGRIDSDIDKAALALDTKYPGSTVLAEKKKYGEGGKYLALVTGSLGNCSVDLNVVVDLIAGINTVRALELRITNQDQLFSMHRRRLVSSFGLFTTRLWARHIHDRFRDAVAVTAPSHTPHFPDPDREITRDYHLSRSHARPQHRGSRRSA
jgi:hypothetical protein